eukprot:jgi/Hompol1/3970/HPOL_003418-RA
MSMQEQELQPQNKLTSSNPLSRKLYGILYLSLDDQEIQTALSSLSNFYSENTPAARRNLKSSIERKIVGVHKEFLSSFDALQKRAVIVDALLSRLTLTDDEIRSLTTNSETVDSNFFAALARTQRAQESCKALLATENQRLGLEILESTRIYLDAAFEKLFRWTQAECRLLKHEMPEITVEFKEGIQALKQRPILFQACMDEVSTIRRNAINRSFQDALIIGGPGGFPRPIEVHAYDALRYIGDILAWVHQACVGEREMLEGLFGLQISSFAKQSKALYESGRSAFDQIEGYRTDEDLLMQILDRNLEGICRVIKTRIESVLVSGLGPITSYRIVNIMQFYLQTVTGVVHSSAKITETLKDENSSRIFLDTLHSQSSDILRFVQLPESDLLPPQAAKETIKQLADFDVIIAALMDPVIQMCESGSLQLKPIESAIYMVNCLNHIATVLAEFSFTEAQLARIRAQIDQQIEVLVNEQYSVILAQSGLASVASSMASNPQPLALHSGTDSKAILEAMSRLDLFLVTVNVDVSETLLRISSLDIAQRVSQNGFRRFVETYRSIVSRIMDPANKV